MVKMVTDAAPSMGMAYILGQFKDPDNEEKGNNRVACVNTTFKKGKCSFSPFEVELAPLHSCITKEDYYIGPLFGN